MLRIEDYTVELGNKLNTLVSEMVESLDQGKRLRNLQKLEFF